MINALIQLALFAAKTFIVLLFIVLVLLAFVAILRSGKSTKQGKLKIRNLNKKYDHVTEALHAELLTKKKFKQLMKEQKAKEKHHDKSTLRNVYVLNFVGDVKASAVSDLTEAINAVLNVASPSDEVVLRLESAGGVVHGYGLAAAQLMRIRERKIPLTITIDKVAASGGYMMAAIANKILAAPFAIVGSIGVLVQLPNFHKLLQEKQIDFEQLSAGEYKRTLTLFGENTTEGREKLQNEIEEIHQQFKALIVQHRQQINIDQVATGEYWLGTQALPLHLVDEIRTSDDYLFNLSRNANLFEVSFETKKPLLAKLFGGHAAANTLHTIANQSIKHPLLNV